MLTARCPPRQDTLRVLLEVVGRQEVVVRGRERLGGCLRAGGASSRVSAALTRGGVGRLIKAAIQGEQMSRPIGSALVSAPGRTSATGSAHQRRPPATVRPDRPLGPAGPRPPLHWPRLSTLRRITQSRQTS